MIFHTIYHTILEFRETHWKYLINCFVPKKLKRHEWFMIINKTYHLTTAYKKKNTFLTTGFHIPFWNTPLVFIQGNTTSGINLGYDRAVSYAQYHTVTPISGIWNCLLFQGAAWNCSIIIYHVTSYNVFHLKLQCIFFIVNFISFEYHILRLLKLQLCSEWCTVIALTVKPLIRWCDTCFRLRHGYAMKISARRLQLYSICWITIFSN